jgi:hypothetical protein
MAAAWAVCGQTTSCVWLVLMVMHAVYMLTWSVQGQLLLAVHVRGYAGTGGSTAFGGCGTSHLVFWLYAHVTMKLRRPCSKAANVLWR